MLNNISQLPHTYLDTARKIHSFSDREIAEIIRQLRDKKELWRTVHALNALLRDGQHRDTALLALRRPGLEYGG